MDWANGVYRGEPRVEDLHAKVVRLRQEVAAAEPVDTTAKMRVAAAMDALSRAETKAAEAENAVSEYIKSQASAFKEDAVVLPTWVTDVHDRVRSDAADQLNAEA